MEKNAGYSICEDLDTFKRIENMGMSKLFFQIFTGRVDLNVDASSWGDVTRDLSRQCPRINTILSKYKWPTQKSSQTV